KKPGQKIDLDKLREECIKLYNKKVRDHDHLNGKYRGPAHQKCNLNYSYLNAARTKCIVPVGFHNLKGYDSHLIMKANLNGWTIKVLSTSGEKFLSFDLIYGNVCYRFIDTMQFLASSLEELVGILKKAGVKFETFNEAFKDVNEELKGLLLQKGVYPYRYMDSPEKFKETKLPDIDAFYNDLNKEDCDSEDYERAQKVFELAGCKNLKDYHDLYLKTDVVLLADVFENFRDFIMQHHNLDPFWFYGLPGVSWYAMLQNTKKINGEWKYVTNPPKDTKTIKPLVIEGFKEGEIDMLLMAENGKRGGICQASIRYAEANNKYLSNYDPTKPSTFIAYHDCNGLYGGAMRENLPIGGFAWEKNPDLITEDFIRNIPDDSEKGCFLEVKLSIPKEKHDYFNDYPLAPINRIGEYSNSMKKIKKILDEADEKKHGVRKEKKEKGEAKSDATVKKLILDLEDKDH